MTSKPKIYTKDIPKNRPWRLVFMGTPEFSVPTLRALIESRHEIVSVYTKPDRPQGRGRKLQPPPIKRVALEAGIPVYQPERMTSKEAITRFREDRPDLAIVIAYGKILRQRILDVPPMGCINCHASLLPAYRGANPIFWALADGCTESGITTMLMDAGMDTGPMLLKDSLPIPKTLTFGELHDQLAQLSADLLIRTLEQMEAGTLPVTEQEHDKATHARMLERNEFWLDFRQPASHVHNWIRAMDPRPGARCKAPDDSLIKLYAAQEVTDHQGQPGQLLEADASGLLVACGNGAVRVAEIQLPGKKRTTIKQYLSGNTFPHDFAFQLPTPSETTKDNET